MNGGYANINLNRDVFTPEGDPTNVSGIFKDVESAFNNEKPICLGGYTVSDTIYGAGFVTSAKVTLTSSHFYILYNDVHFFKVYNNDDVEIFNINEEEE